MFRALDQARESFLVRTLRPSRPRAVHPVGIAGPRPRPRRACRPRLTRLEDRVAFSTWTVSSSADDVTQNYTLPYAVAHAQNGDTILLTAAVKNPIVLTHGELVLSQDVTIESVPSRTPTISGDGQGWDQGMFPASE